MIESILAILAAVVGLVVWLIRREAARKDAHAPEKVQQETDADLTNADPTWLAVRLSRLYDKARSRRRPPQ